LISVEMQIKNLSPVMNQQRHPMPMKAHDGGFSLIEILVVIGAIGILLGIAVPAYNGYREKSQIAAAMQDLKRIETAIIALGTNTMQWPGGESVGKEGSTEIENLNSPEAGLTNNDDGDFSSWNGPYIPSVPLDPWGTHYFFDPDYNIPGGPSQVPVIGSYGPNGVGKNLYDSDDVITRLACKKSDCS
jgi:general secretion pathway protein G